MTLEPCSLAFGVDERASQYECVGSDASPSSPCVCVCVCVARIASQALDIQPFHIKPKLTDFLKNLVVK